MKNLWEDFVIASVMNNDNEMKGGSEMIDGVGGEVIDGMVLKKWLME